MKIYQFNYTVAAAPQTDCTYKKSQKTLMKICVQAEIQPSKWPDFHWCLTNQLLNSAASHWLIITH